MALGMLSVGAVIHRVQMKIEWGNIIYEFLGEKALPIAGISEDAMIQFFSVVGRLRVSSPRDSAERDKPTETRTRQSLQLNAQSWTRVVSEVLDQTALSVETIPGEVLIQILEVVYEMRIHPENPDLIAEEPSSSRPKSQSPESQPEPPQEPQPERQPLETDGHNPLPGLADQPGIGGSMDEHENPDLIARESQPERQLTEINGHNPLPGLADQPGIGGSMNEHEDDSPGMNSR